MRKWIILLFVAAVGFTFFLSHTALAQSEKCAEQFKSCDTNNDGMVSMDEFKACFDSGQYAGTVPTPSSKPDAFEVFEALGGTKEKPITEKQFCSGWH